MVNLLLFTLIVIGSLMGAWGNLLVKKGTNQYPFFQLWKSYNVWLGLILFAISTLMYLLVLHFEELSVLYPLGSLTYIWTIFFSVRFLGEKMNAWKWVGLAGIILGIIFIGIGASQ